MLPVPVWPYHLHAPLRARADDLVRVSPDKFFNILFGTLSFINEFFEDFVILEIKFFSLPYPPLKHQYFSQMHAV